MAKTGGGGLLRLDDICAKLKNSRQEENGEEKPSKEVETNNNERPEEEAHSGATCLQNGQKSGARDVGAVNGAANGEDLSQGYLLEMAANGDAVCDTNSGAAAMKGPSPLPDSTSTVSSPAQDTTSVSVSSKPSSPFQDTNSPVSNSTTPASQTPGGRKNKRKNFRPKNITQFQDGPEDPVKEDLEEYEANNRGVDFSAITTTEEDLPISLPLQEGPIELTNYASRDNQGEKPIDFVTDDCGALDLSTCSRPPSDESASNAADMELEGPQDLSTKSLEDPSPEKVARGPSQAAVSMQTSTPMKKVPEGSMSSRDASCLKDYAESTMNELMRIYGFPDEGESITQGVPLEHFESRSILEMGSPLAGSAQPSLASVLQAATARPRTSPSKTLPSTNGGYSPGGATSEVGKIGEGIYAKFVDSMSKISKMPQGTVIGSPPALLPSSTASVASASASTPVAHSHAETATSTPGAIPTLPGKSPGKPSTAASNFATSAAYIKACFDPTLGPKLAAASASGGKNALPDYSRYVKRYLSFEECGGNHCHDMAYKEHFHCMDCSFRVFVKKEEMIRHFKWHKKRDESLQHGFMRYSPMDNCVERFGPCTHNGRQTHYHCLQSGCTKVYISTSDVQMHANYHRKDSAIIQEGFQRFRATEDCGTPECSFYGQRTTHFHCRRGGCTFTFKNKADMEKHKTYHQKDELLAKDGFKKFMKYEACSYSNCRYSQVSNHIHCTRPGCDYVLHSTGQLYPHKRKHERRDFEHAYKRFKEEQKQKPMLNPAIQQQMGVKPSSQSFVKQEQEFVDIAEFARMKQIDLDDSMLADLVGARGTSPTSVEMKQEIPNKAHASTLAKLASKLAGQPLNDSLNLPIPGYVKTESSSANEEEVQDQAVAMNLSSPALAPKPTPPVNEKKERDESWKKYLTRYTANDPCYSRCQLLYKDHYHCNMLTCGMLFKSKDGVREHAKQHETQDRITSLSFMVYSADTACAENCHLSKQQKHYHCLWADCKHVISEKDQVFSRLEHHKIHEFARTVRKNPGMIGTGVNAQDFQIRRRRGRPPKYPKNEIPVVPKIEMTEEEIAAAATLQTDADAAAIAHGFQKFSAGQPCPDDKCMYFMRLHYHCLRKRCHHSTDRADVLTLHAKDFHNYVVIMDGFEFFDRNVNCRRPHCHNNKANRHYHCVRPRCDYSFVRHSTMAQHDNKHKMAEMGLTPSPTIAIPKSAIMAPRLNALPLSMQQLAIPLGTQMLVSSPGGATCVTSSAQMITSAGTFYPVSSGVRPGGNQLVMASTPQMAFTLPPGVSTVPPSGVIPMPSASPISPIVIQPIADTSLMSTSSSQNLVNIAPKPATTATATATKPVAPPLSVLLQQKAQNTLPQLNWLNMKMKMHYGMYQNCARPFCKLKKKDHYHCFHCNHAFSDPVRLKVHIVKQGVNLDKIDTSQDFTCNPDMADGSLTPSGDSGKSEAEMSDEEPTEEPAVSDSLNLNAGTFSNLLQQQTQAGGMGEDEDEDSRGNDLVIDFSRAAYDQEEEMEEDKSEGDCNGKSTPARRSRRKRTATRHDDFVDSDTAVNCLKKQRMASSPRSSCEENKAVSSPKGATPKVTSPKATSPKATSPKATSPKSARGKKTEDVPLEGCDKFRWTEDCLHERCAFRLSQAHYHCTRENCGYSFSDRNRFLRHQERHKQREEIMGDEFKQFRMGQDCGRPDCEHVQKASHFHCLKCPFICTDSTKVTAHRRNHSKLEQIATLGFTKFAQNEPCGKERCHYSGTQTHYHCQQCTHVAVGPAQMASHKAKHDAPKKNGAAAAANAP